MSKQDQMFRMIIRWQDSGQPQKSWCEKHGLAYGTFHYWYRRFRDHQMEDTGTEHGSFIPVVHSFPTTLPWCEVRGSNGKRLVFHQPVEVGLLTALLD